MQDNKADDGDPRFWKEAKFQELLMQLRYSIPPDQSVVVDRKSLICLGLLYADYLHFQTLL